MPLPHTELRGEATLTQVTCQAGTARLRGWRLACRIRPRVARRHTGRTPQLGHPAARPLPLRLGRRPETHPAAEIPGVEVLPGLLGCPQAGRERVRDERAA